jgi:hypothetical protein
VHADLRTLLVAGCRYLCCIVSPLSTHQPPKGQAKDSKTARLPPSHIFHNGAVLSSLPYPLSPLSPLSVPSPSLLVRLLLRVLSPFFRSSHAHTIILLVRRLSYPGDYLPSTPVVLCDHHQPVPARLPMSSSSNGASGVSTPPSVSSANANGLRSPPKITSMASKALADNQRKQSSSPMDQTQRYVSHPACSYPHPFCYCCSPRFHLNSPHTPILRVISFIATLALADEFCSSKVRSLNTIHLHHPFSLSLFQASFTYSCMFRKSSMPPAWTKGSTNPVTQRPVGLVTANGVPNSSGKASPAQKGASNSSKDSTMAGRNGNDRFGFLLQNFKVCCFGLAKFLCRHSLLSFHQYTC